MKLKIEFEADNVAGLIGDVKNGLEVLENGLEAKTKTTAPTVAPAKGRKAKAVEEDDSFELPGGDEEIDADLDSDGESDDTPTLDLENDVLPAFNDFVKRRTKKLGSKDKALGEVKKILAKFKVANVRKLKESDYAAAMEEVAA